MEKDDTVEGEGEQGSEDEDTVDEETGSKPMAVQAVRAANGSLQNGDFTAYTTEGTWMPEGWSLTGGEYKESDGNPGGFVQSAWNSSGDTTFSISQVIENFPARRLYAVCRY